MGVVFRVEFGLGPVLGVDVDGKAGKIWVFGFGVFSQKPSKMKRKTNLNFMFYCVLGFGTMTEMCSLLLLALFLMSSNSVPNSGHHVLSCYLFKMNFSSLWLLRKLRKRKRK